MSGGGNGAPALARRAVVTGLGVVSALGIGREEHFRRLLAGEAGVGPWPGGERHGLPVRHAAAVAGFEPRRSVRDRRLRKVLQPSALHAVAAATEALADAGLPCAGRDDEAEPAAGALGAGGIYFGSVSYDLPSRLHAPALRAAMDRDGRFSFARFGRQGVALVDPLLILRGMPNGALCGISIEHGIAGPNVNFANGAAGGLEAVAAAAAAVRRGEVALALAGGSDSLLQPEHQIDHLVRGRLWSGEGARPTACRPFARGRCGYLLGEGAAVVVVESAAHALARGARIYGELLGDGETTAAHEEDGAAALAAAARAALAGSEGAPPDALFGQGIGTSEDDRREAAAARAAGGGAPLTAATAALGYTGAASGVLALAHALWSLDRGVLPPTLGCDDPDPECAVELVERAKRRELRSALVWASHEGRKHVAVLAGRFTAPAAAAAEAAA